MKALKIERNTSYSIKGKQREVTVSASWLKTLRKNIEEFIGMYIRENSCTQYASAGLQTQIVDFIFQVYAPTEQQDKWVKDIFYDQLSSVLQDAHKNVMVIGDFNGRIGSQ